MRGHHHHHRTFLSQCRGQLLFDPLRRELRPDRHRHGQPAPRGRAGAGCGPGDLKLIVLTHGDVDHCGNAACLRGRFSAPIAMHRDDAGMVEHDDMFWNRKAPNPVIRAIFGVFFRLSQADRFEPDVYLEDGQSLVDHGLNATVLHVPGHSKGSLAVMTAAGDLFCGDLLANTRQPELGSIIDDAAAASASLDQLKRSGARMVYPGHGRPFLMEQLA